MNIASTAQRAGPAASAAPAAFVVLAGPRAAGLRRALTACRLAAIAATVCAAAAIAAPQAARAQFSMVPAPLLQGPPQPSAAEGDKAYRVDAARHLYTAYPMRIYRGKMPPLLYSVMAVETEIDATGAIVNVSVVRKPAADEVAPWVVAMIRRAGPFPAPARMTGGTLRYFDVWLVDKSGLFQIDTLTEGQR